MKLLTTLLLAILITSAGLGQNISNLKLNNKQSILNDKAFFDFPAAAKNNARETDIMSADPNANKKTRIVLDSGKQRLVFFARELYLTSGNDLLQIISKENPDARCKVLTNRDSLISVLGTSTEFDSSKQTIAINDLFVRTQDTLPC